jgi:hypothetical protein
MKLILKILVRFSILFVIVCISKYLWLIKQNIEVHSITLDWRQPSQNNIRYVIKEIESHGYAVEYGNNFDEEIFLDSSYAVLPSGGRNLGFLLDNIAVKYNLRYKYCIGNKIFFEKRSRKGAVLFWAI